MMRAKAKTVPGTLKGRLISVTLIFRIFLLLFTVRATAYQAQKKMTRKQFQADSLKIIKTKLVRPQFRFDNRLVFVKGQPLNITGFDAGVLLKNKLRLALGYYSVSDKLSSFNKTIGQDEYQGRYDLKYVALNVEFIYLNKRFFSLGMPLEFGFGNNSLYYRSELANLESEKESGVVALSYFGLSGTFKPIRWIGLKGAVGFRKTIYDQVKPLSFDGLYTSVGLSLDVWEVIKDFRLFKLKNGTAKIQIRLKRLWILLQIKQIFLHNETKKRPFKK